MWLIYLAGNLDSRYDYNGNSLGDTFTSWLINGVSSLFTWLWQGFIGLSYWICLFAAIICIFIYIETREQKYKGYVMLSILAFVIIQGIKLIGGG